MSHPGLRIRARLKVDGRRPHRARTRIADALKDNPTPESCATTAVVADASGARYPVEARPCTLADRTKCATSVACGPPVGVSRYPALAVCRGTEETGDAAPLRSSGVGAVRVCLPSGSPGGARPPRCRQPAFGLAGSAPPKDPEAGLASLAASPEEARREGLGRVGRPGGLFGDAGGGRPVTGRSPRHPPRRGSSADAPLRFGRGRLLGGGRGRVAGVGTGSGFGPGIERASKPAPGRSSSEGSPAGGLARAGRAAELLRRRRGEADSGARFGAG